MKKVLLALLVAVGFSLAAALPVGADPVGSNPPACGDIYAFKGDAVYHKTSPPQNTVEDTIFVNADATCKDITYTMYVTYSAGGKEKIRSQSLHGNGVDFSLRFLISNVFPDGDSTPCVYFTSAKGNNIIDRVPDEGCDPAVLDSIGGGGGTIG
jgi:hypothetical protein